MPLFDPLAFKRQREHASRYHDHDHALLTIITTRMIDRLNEIQHRFPSVLELGGRHGLLTRPLSTCPIKNRLGIEKVITSDPAPAFASLAPSPSLAINAQALPFPHHSFDLILSPLYLHWVENLPQALSEIRRVLKPHSLFLATLVGGYSLSPLRQAFIKAEHALNLKPSPHIIPFATIGDLAFLLQKTGFALPMVDIDTITIPYQNPWTLMQALKTMGEGNSLTGRTPHLNQRTLLLKTATYLNQCRDHTGMIPATFNIHYLTAWTNPQKNPN